MRQATLGENQYHAAIFKFEKRVSNGWGGRINYTYSRLEDNQFGEGNFFSRNSHRSAGRLQPRCGVRHRPPRRAAQDRLLADLRAAVRRGQAVGDERRGRGHPRRLGRLVDHLARERLPDFAERELQRPQRARRPHAARQPRLWRSRDRRHPHRAHHASRGHRVPDATIAASASGSTPGVATDPSASCSARRRAHLDDVRTPHRNNGTSRRARTSAWRHRCAARSGSRCSTSPTRRKVRGPITAVGSSTFGQIRVQAGFMRLTQLMFRLTLLRLSGLDWVRRSVSSDIRERPGRLASGRSLYVLTHASFAAALTLVSACHSALAQRSISPRHLSARSRSQTPVRPAAQGDFLRGVAWLHSFCYEDAIDAFRAAQKIDPTFAMAYWGEAMSFNQPLWFFEEVEQGPRGAGQAGADAGGALAKGQDPARAGVHRARSKRCSDPATSRARASAHATGDGDARGRDSRGR